MGAVWSSYLSALDTSPLRTKTATSIFITALGNVTSQLVQSRQVKDWGAVKMYATWGLILAPFNHAWQNAIAAYGPGSLVGKIVVDHLLWKVPIVWAFITFTKLYGGAQLGAAMKEGTRLSQWNGDIQIASVKSWPLIQVFNFWVVPLKLRVLYMNTSLLFWIVYLAIKLRKGDGGSGKKGGKAGKKE